MPPHLKKDDDQNGDDEGPDELDPEDFEYPEPAPASRPLSTQLGLRCNACGAHGDAIEVIEL